VLTAGLLLSACTAPAQVDLNATAQAMARAWGTQTAEAQPPPASTNTEVPNATLAVGTAVPGLSDTTTPAQPPAPASTVTQPPPLPATAMQTPTLKHTATPIVTAKPTAIPTSTTTPPACPVAVDAALASGWNYLKLGCPKAPATVVWSAWQPFEHGNMIWMEDTDWVYALNYGGGTDSKQGDWATGGESWRWDDSFPDGHGLTPPEELVEPIRGFGFVWFSKLGGPTSTIGWGTAEEKGFCALVQPFDNGMLIQSSTVPVCADGQFNWAATAKFPPVFIALYGDGGWERF